MKIKKSEKLNFFTREFKKDKKHKINTSAKKIISEDLIREIEKEGLTSERIDELGKKNYDIYQYNTQLTIHGKCNVETDGYIGYYKSMVINKNKSVGIKWLGLDLDKKMYIGGQLYHDGWFFDLNSQGVIINKHERVKNEKQAIEVYNKYKKMMSNLDTNLFLGSYDIYCYNHAWYGMMIYVDLYIHSVYKKNVEKIVEQITGKEVKHKYRF